MSKESIREELIKLIGKGDVVVLLEIGYVKIRVTGCMEYLGDNLWKVENTSVWKSEITFHTQNVREVGRQETHTYNYRVITLLAL